jgi:hypothetical protein
MTKCGTFSRFQSITKPPVKDAAIVFPKRCSLKYKVASKDFAPPAEVMYFPSFTKSTFFF